MRVNNSGLRIMKLHLDMNIFRKVKHNYTFITLLLKIHNLYFENRKSVNSNFIPIDILLWNNKHSKILFSTIKITYILSF